MWSAAALPREKGRGGETRRDWGGLQKGAAGFTLPEHPDVVPEAPGGRVSFGSSSPMLDCVTIPGARATRSRSRSVTAAQVASLCERVPVTSSRLWTPSRMKSMALAGRKWAKEVTGNTSGATRVGSVLCCI